VGYAITNKWRACGAKAKRDFYDSNLSKLVDSEQDSEDPSIVEAVNDDFANLIADEEEELKDLISAHEHVAMLRDNGVDLSSLYPEASSSRMNILSVILFCGVVVRALS